MCNRDELAPASELFREWRILELRRELAHLEHGEDDAELDAIVGPMQRRQIEIEHQMVAASVRDLSDLLGLFDLGRKIISEGGTEDRRENAILDGFRAELVHLLGRHRRGRA